MVAGIAAQATALKHQQVQEALAMQTAKMAMDTVAAQGQAIVQMLEATVEMVQDPNLGNRIDVRG